MYLTLDRAYELCLMQWDFVIEELDLDSTLSIGKLKRLWLDRNWSLWEQGDRPCANCFFCEYDWRHRGRFCSHCPGRLVDKSFDCRNPPYNYVDHPHAFRDKIRALDKKRRDG